MSLGTDATPYAGPRPDAAPIDEPAGQAIGKVALASAIGTAIEYFDFNLYGIATALVFNKIFFPSFDPLVGTLAAFSTFFLGYCARPLGGVLFGHFGDRLGRKVVLMITIVIMGLGTVAIGLMPSYATIGVWAPIGLVTLRVFQGIGIGGEYGGGMVMTVEHAPPGRRGFYSSLVHIGVPFGFLVPILLLALLSAVMDDATFLAWGWRLPFLFSIVLVGLGLWIRFQISESPAFRRVLATQKPAAIPAYEAICTYPKSILCGIGAKIAESGLFNIYAAFSIVYCVVNLHLTRQTILDGVLIGCAVECFALPYFGALSDRIGRRAVYAGGMIFQLLLAYPFFLMVNSGQTVLIWLAIALGLGFGHGSVYGAQGAYFSELFPARIRYSGLSLVQQIGPILGGGLSPLIATAVLAAYGGYGAVVAYMAAMALFSALCTLGLRTYRET